VGKIHTVSSSRPDLAMALNAAEGVQDIKVGQSALKKLVGQAEALLEEDEQVQFGAYEYQRGIAMVTYYIVVLTDRRLLKLNRTTWKLEPVTVDREAITGVTVGQAAQPTVAITTQTGQVAQFHLRRPDAERLAGLLGA